MLTVVTSELEARAMKRHYEETTERKITLLFVLIYWTEITACLQHLV